MANQSKQPSRNSKTQFRAARVPLDIDAELTKRAAEENSNASAVMVESLRHYLFPDSKEEQMPVR